MIGLFKTILFAILARADAGGVLEVCEDGRVHRFGHDDSKIHAVARIEVRDRRFYRRLIVYGDVGLGEAYFLSYFDTPDLRELLLWFWRNRACLPSFGSDPRWSFLFEWASPLLRLAHRLRKNTKEGSRRNIREHYDVSNDFYRLWLDGSMSYSAAVYGEGMDLAQAQENKYRQICDGINLSDGDQLLEIGCGWGAFAIYAARRCDCRITAITISDQQYRLARERIEAAGLSGRIEVRLQDYRDLSGKFDKIVSIEMMEALGHEYVPLFLEKCRQTLRSGGRMCLQCITYPDKHFAHYLRGNNYIKKHIFPGGELISLEALRAEMAAMPDLRIDRVDSIGPDYARTLAQWRQNLAANKTGIIALGFDEPFYRKWYYYLAYCEVGFETAYLDDVQLLIGKS